MKRFLAFALALVLCMGTLAACGQEKKQDEKPEPKVEDDGVLKILMIGHSLGMDSTFLLPEVARKEGVTDLVVGVLYHSGCRLSQHVQYLENDTPQYAYFEYDLATDQDWRRADAQGNFQTYTAGDANDTLIDDGTIGQTMQFGITRQDWDLVVLQAGVFEAGNVADGGFSPDLPSHIKKITDYVKEQDIQKNTQPQFAWNITWACPTEELLNSSYSTSLLGLFGDTTTMYTAIANTAKDVVPTCYDFQYIFPAGTAIQYTRTEMTDFEIYRDTIHVNDFGRLVAAYTWYCTLMDTDIQDCKLETVSSNLLLDVKARNTNTDLVLTDQQKQTLINAVGKACQNPYGTADILN